MPQSVLNLAPDETEFPHAVHDFYKPSHVDASISDWGPSLTRQEFAEDCDINVIMQRFERDPNSFPQRTGVVQYLDLTQTPSDLMTALTQIHDAETAFMTLPAVVRREFENDPVQFVEFASDPENRPQMVTWGLAEALPAPVPGVQDILDRLPPIAPKEPPAAP